MRNPPLFPISLSLTAALLLSTPALSQQGDQIAHQTPSNSQSREQIAAADLCPFSTR